MLPADVIAEIIANLAALNLQPSTAAAVLGALAPLLRTAETPPAVLEPEPSRRPRSSKRPRRGRRKRKYKRQAPSEARDRALAALRANPPDASATEIAKIAKVSRSTVVKTRNEIEKAERKQAAQVTRNHALDPLEASRAPPARAAFPARATRAWPQAGERRRGGGR